MLALELNDAGLILASGTATGTGAAERDHRQRARAWPASPMPAC